MASAPKDQSSTGPQEDLARQLAEVGVDLGATPREVETVPDVRALLAAKAGLRGDDVSLTPGVWASTVVHLTTAFEQAARAHQRRSAPNSRRPLPICQDCAQPIAWARTLADKAMPLDPVAHPMGNVILANRGQSRLVAEVVGLDEIPLQGTRPAYRPHFATCAGASELARRRQAQSVTQAACSSCGGPIALDLILEGRTTHLGPCEDGPPARNTTQARRQPAPPPPPDDDDDQLLLFPRRDR